MDIARERRNWIEALHNQNVQSQKLLTVILRLGQSEDKEAVISAFRSATSEAPVEKDGHVIFGTLALKFDDEGRLVDLFQVVSGTTTRAEVVILSSSDD